jgi:hypothetical protein
MPRSLSTLSSFGPTPEICFRSSALPPLGASRPAGRSSTLGAACSAGAGLAAGFTAFGAAAFGVTVLGAAALTAVFTAVFVAVFVAGFTVTFATVLGFVFGLAGTAETPPVRAEKAAAPASGAPIHKPAHVATAVLAATAPTMAGAITGVDRDVSHMGISPSVTLGVDPRFHLGTEM